MKRMLFNATHAEELRVAIVDGQKLIDLDLEAAVRAEKKGNIYKGVITKVEPSLEACFVDYGSEKQGFLPLKEIYRGYFNNYDGKTQIADTKIDAVIKEGQKMIVQVDKDERGTKGAALTTFVSLAGRFLVFMPNNPKGGGISRRITGEDRNELRDTLAALEINGQHSLIARTEGIGRSQEELQWDLDFLVKLWENIEQASTSNSKAPFLIYRESNLIVRSIRDHLSEDIAEVIVDDEEIHERAERFITQVMPHNLKKLKLYKDSVPLFSRYQIEGQIDSAFNRVVTLPSGGSLSIDHTEALISIDVNSARATKGSDIEETALNTNLEAVEEVARQLRIRDIGGLVVIDLIDMSISRNQRVVENRLKESLKADRARVQVGHISRFGLLEMSRQRLRSSISDMNHQICPRCDGMGTIRNIVSASLHLLRIIEDETLKENTEALQVVLPLDMATYLLNEKRHELCQLEARLASRTIIIPSAELSSPHFRIKRLRNDDLEKLADITSFHQTVDIEDKGKGKASAGKSRAAKQLQAHVQLDQVTPPPFEPPAPSSAAESGEDTPGMLPRLMQIFFGKGKPSETAESTDGSTDRKKTGRRTPAKNMRSDSRDRNRNRGRGKDREKGDENQEKRAGKNTRTQRTRQKPPPKNPRPKKAAADTQQDGSRSGTNNPRQQNLQNQDQPAKTKSPSDQSSASSAQKRPPRSPQSKAHKPRSGSAATSSNRGQQRSKQQRHSGLVITQGDIPADMPDDIGNRKD